MFPTYVDEKIVEIYKNNVKQFLLDLYSRFKSRKIVIWGTGLYGRAVASLLMDNSFNVVSFCDSFFDESENKSIVLNGKQIQVHGCRFNFEHFQDAVYFISTDYYQDIIELIKKENITIEYFLDLNSQYIEKQLVYFGDYPKFDQLVGVTYNWFLLYKDFVNKGAFKSDYQTLVKLFSNDEMSIEIINKRLMTLLTGDLNYNNSIPLTFPQYFSKNYYESSNLNQGAYIDVGAFNGDTIFDYIKYFGQQNRKILAFEPDENNFKQLSDVVKSSNLKNIELFKAAVGACSGKVSFSQNGNMGSHIVDKDNASDLVEIFSLSDFIKYNPSFIKMDIEGAELDALKGAEDLIKLLKPNLAICLYDLLERMYKGDVPEFCKGCYHLRVKNVDKVYKFLDPIRYITLCGSKYCNLRCEHCFFIRDNKDIKDTDISKVINFLGLLKSKGHLSEFKALRLANGEPSIIKDDIKLADYCIENSIPVEIYTNGAKVPKTFVDGVNKGLFRIILSPDAGSREVYKKIKGKDYFETTWFNIKKYVEETSGNVEVKFILEKGNIDDVDNMINMCLKTGVNKVHLSMDVNISETEFYKYESSFSHFVNRCKNEGINLLSIFTFVPEQIKNKVSNLSTE